MLELCEPFLHADSRCRQRLVSFPSGISLAKEELSLSEWLSNEIKRTVLSLTLPKVSSRNLAMV